MPDNDYHLDSMVCFAIYSASNAVAKAHRLALEPWELTYTQYIALLETRRAPEGLTVSKLGARMSLDSGTLSPLLRRLNQRGLLSRDRNSADERVVTVKLTATGAAVLKDVIVALNNLSGAYGFQSPEQAQALVQELHRITEGMRALSAPVRSSSTPVTNGSSTNTSPKGSS